MATTTAKMALRKPATSDTVNVTTDISDSMQKLDDTLPTYVCTSSTRPGTPFTGQLIFETDTKVYRIWDAAAWRKVLLGDVTTDADSNVGPDPTSFRNVIRNGGMDIWQRGAGPFTAAGYTADGYVLNPGSGATCQVDRLAIANGAIAGRGKYGLQWARSVAGTTVSWIDHRIEDVATFAGETVTISLEAWTASGSVDFTLSLDQYFGTGGSPSSRVVGTVSAVKTATTAVATKFTYTVALASISGKTKGTDGNDALILMINRAHNSTNGATGTVYIRNVQIERGSVATPFEVRPYNEILAQCHRYFIRYTNASVVSSFAFLGPMGTAGSTTLCNIPLLFPVPMRKTPTVGSSGTFQVVDTNSAGITATGVSIIASLVSHDAGADTNVAGVLLQYSVASGLTQYRPYMIYLGSGYLQLTAEI